MRPPIDEAEILAAATRLESARDLMLNALNLIDGTAVSTGCDCYLDHAIHNLSAVIDSVKAGADVFTSNSRVAPLVTARDFAAKPAVPKPPNAWE